MRKSTLFISAALTTFMLAVMFGVASAYQKIVQASVPTEAAQQTQSTEVMPVTSSTASGAVTLEQAADLASKVIGRNDLYASENAQLDGVDSYLVTFSSGDIVYVSLDGKILSISKLPVTYILSQTTSQGGGGGNNGGNSSTTEAPPAQVITGGGDDQSGEDHSNEDNSNNTEDHANEDHPTENEHDD